MTAQRGPCAICGVGEVEWDDEGCHPVGVAVTDAQARDAMAYLHDHPGVITEEIMRGAICAAIDPGPRAPEVER